MTRAFKLIVAINREIYKARNKDGKKLKDKDVYVEIGDPNSNTRVRLSRDQVKNLNSAYKHMLSELSKYHEYAGKAKGGRKGLVNIQKVRPEFVKFVKDLIAGINGVNLDTSAKNLPFFNDGFMVMTTFISVISAYIRDLRAENLSTKFVKSFPVDDTISNFLTKTVPRKVRERSTKSKGKIKLNFKNRIAPKLHTEIQKSFNGLIDERDPRNMLPIKAYIIDLLYYSGADIDRETGEDFAPGMLLLNKKEHAAIIQYMEANNVGFPSVNDLVATNVSSKNDNTDASLDALDALFNQKHARTDDLLSGARKITAAALLEVSLYSPFLHTKHEAVNAPDNRDSLAAVLFDGSLKNLGYNSANDFKSGFPNSLKMVIPSLMSVSKTDAEKAEVVENRDAILDEYQTIKEAVSVNMPSESDKRAGISAGSKKRASDIKAAFAAVDFASAGDRKYFETRYKTAALRAYDDATGAYELEF